MKVLCLVNRTLAPVEFTFDSQQYVVKPGVPMMCAENVAWHGFNKNIARLDPVTGEALYLLGVKDSEGQEIRDCEPLDYVKAVNEELLDRSNMEGNFKTVKFSNPDAQKARVQPVQMSGSFSDAPRNVAPAPAFDASLRAPDADEGDSNG
jgi:hypothetical protein